MGGINFTPRGQSRNGQNRTATKKLMGGLQMNEARLVKEGFPIADRTFSKEEIKEYFSGDLITCLLCGRDFKIIGAMHLRRIHGITGDQYREKYGLPYRHGLTSAEYRERMIKRGKELVANGTFKCTAADREKAHQAIRDGKMRFCKSHKAVNAENIKKMQGVKPITIEEVRGLFQQMINEDIGLTEAIKKNGRGFSSISTFIRENDMNDEYEATFDHLSLKTLAASQKINDSKKWVNLVNKLRDEGKTYDEISIITGIGWGTVQNIITKKFGDHA